jgi:hypothetical protein
MVATLTCRPGSEARISFAAASLGSTCLVPSPLVNVTALSLPFTSSATAMAIGVSSRATAIGKVAGLRRLSGIMFIGERISGKIRKEKRSC